MKPIRNAENVEFKPAFVERYSKLTDWEPYKKISLTYLRKSIRVNTLKISVKDCIARLKDRFNLTPIPWSEDGFWIEHKKGRLDIGNTIEHALGYYYVQEAASMIPPLVLNPQPGEHVLDVAASPGSKSSQIASMMENSGILVANDVTGLRLAALGINLQRTGVVNSIITLCAGERIKGVMFDKILLDAPCSGTGTIRKSLKTLLMWNPDMIKRLAGLQRKLLVNAWSLLKPGGTLVYSTCSQEPEEDEAIVDFAIKNLSDVKVEQVKLPHLKSTPPITSFDGKEYSPEVKKCLRLWPQDNDTEGFFVAKLVKKD